MDIRYSWRNYAYHEIILLPAALSRIGVGHWTDGGKGKRNDLDRKSLNGTFSRKFRNVGTLGVSLFSQFSWSGSVKGNGRCGNSLLLSKLLWIGGLKKTRTVLWTTFYRSSGEPLDKRYHDLLKTMLCVMCSWFIVESKSFFTCLPLQAMACYIPVHLEKLHQTVSKHLSLTNYFLSPNMIVPDWSILHLIEIKVIRWIYFYPN